MSRYKIKRGYNVSSTSADREEKVVNMLLDKGCTLDGEPSKSYHMFRGEYYHTYDQNLNCEKDCNTLLRGESFPFGSVIITEL